MKKSQGLSIILPVYNEEKNIIPVITDILSSIKRFTMEFEIIAVNDGSKDRTSEILHSLAQKNREIKVITHRKNKGYGAALVQGINNAGKEFILLMDADRQFRINSLRALWDKRHNYDFIIGYREKRNDNIYRRIMGKIGNYTAGLLLKKDIKDINCGFKLFKRKILKGFVLTSKGGIINFEILCKLIRNKASFTQAPVNHYKRKSGSSTGGRAAVIIKIIMEFIGLMLKSCSQPY